MNHPLWYLRSLVVIAALGAPGWLYAQGAPAPKKPDTPAVTSAADTVRTPRNHVYHFMAQGPGNVTGYYIPAHLPASVNISANQWLTRIELRHLC